MIKIEILRSLRSATSNLQTYPTTVKNLAARARLLFNFRFQFFSLLTNQRFSTALRGISIYRPLPRLSSSSSNQTVRVLSKRLNKRAGFSLQTPERDFSENPVT